MSFTSTKLMQSSILRVGCSCIRHINLAWTSSSSSSSRTSRGSSSSSRSHRQHRCAAVEVDQQITYSLDAVTSSIYEEDQYELTQQSQQRRSWQASVRSATGRKHQVVWEPSLSPPALLNGVCVVLVGPKKPISCGVVARACSCFECEDIRFVQPRCDHNTRSSRSVSKGAQYILHRAQLHDTLQAALADCDLSIAFTRWLPELQHKALPDIPSLLAHPAVQQMMQQPHSIASSSGSSTSSSRASDAKDQSGSQQQQRQLVHAASADSSSQLQEQQRPVRIALVFGREEYGLSDSEVAACDLACAISIGRLQESLSLSHAVSIVLAQLYQGRLSAVAAASAVATAALPYTVRSVDDLARGYDASTGTEH